MAERPNWGWQQLLETGTQFTDELVRTTRKRADELVAVLRRQIQRQVQAFGIATTDDVSRLEGRVRAAEQAGNERAGAKAAKDAARKGPAKRKAGSKKPSGSS